MDGKSHFTGVDNLACWIDDDDNIKSDHQSDVRTHAKARFTVSSPSTLAASSLTNNNVIEPVRSKEKNETPDGISDHKSSIDFDDILPHVGEFGTYQIVLFFLTAPFCFFLAFAYFSQVFITLVPDHTCHVPQLSNHSELNITQK